MVVLEVELGEGAVADLQARGHLLTEQFLKVLVVVHVQDVPGDADTWGSGEAFTTLACHPPSNLPSAGETLTFTLNKVIEIMATLTIQIAIRSILLFFLFF